MHVPLKLAEFIISSARKKTPTGRVNIQGL